MSKDQNLEKIRALLNKTIENGATEQEAIQSIALAKKLMEKYQVTLEDLKKKSITKEDFGAAYSPNPYSKFEDWVANAIAIYTGVIAYKEYQGVQIKGRRRKTAMVFFGHRVDVELAMYMLQVCNVALQTEWDKYASENGIHKGRISDFSVGMAMSIVKKISILYHQENAAKASAGTDLIVLKNQLVTTAYEDYIKDQGMVDKKSSYQIDTYKDESALKRGYSAGEKVELHRKFSDKKVLKIK